MTYTITLHLKRESKPTRLSGVMQHTITYNAAGQCMLTVYFEAGGPPIQYPCDSYTSLVANR